MTCTKMYFPKFLKCHKRSIKAEAGGAAVKKAVENTKIQFENVNLDMALRYKICCF